MNETVTTFRVPLWLRFRRWALRTFFKRFFLVFFKISVKGEENIPSEGGYLIAYNHVSLFEPPLILAFWPVPPEALAGVDVWDRGGLQGSMVRGYGAMPVSRGEYDREVINKMMRALRGGRPLAISPEGGRSNKPGMRRALPGVAYLMGQAGVPIVPVAITKASNESLALAVKGQRNPLKMQIGKPFMLPPIEGKGAARREARQRNADLVMLRIGAMLPEEYHGVYAGQVPESFED